MKRISIFLLGFLLLTLVFSVELFAEKLFVHFIDVGQGDAILIESQEAFVLIDGGDRWNSVGETLVSYLEDQEVSTLDAIFSTHPHADHIGGLPAVMKNFNVQKIYDSGRVHTTQTYENYLELIYELEIPYATPRRGDEITIGDLDFLVLHPGENVEEYSINNASIVLRLEYGEVSFLFTGDAEKEAEREMIESGLPLETTILKVGHHGSRTSTNPFFLEEVSPEVGVVQVGEDNRFGHPHPEVKEGLAEEGTEIFRNDLHGNIVIKTDGEEYWVEKETERAKETEKEDLININESSPAELKDLPGIGEVLAERIVEYREIHGSFSSYEEIKKVRGIGPGTLERIKDFIVLE